MKYSSGRSGKRKCGEMWNKNTKYSIVKNENTKSGGIINEKLKYKIL